MASNCLPAGDITITASSATAYTVNGSPNAALTLCRGRTYNFVVSSPNHPFWIKTAPVTGASTSAFTDGVTNNGTGSGTVSFAVPASAPSALFYICQFHAAMTGALTIVD